MGILVTLVPVELALMALKAYLAYLVLQEGRVLKVTTSILDQAILVLWDIVEL